MPVNLPADLRQAVRARKCIIFVGSGLSSAAGYPSWSQLLDTLVDEAKKVPNAPIVGLDKYVAAGDYLTLAEFARHQLGRNQYANILKRLLNKPAKPSPAHLSIAQTDYRGLITTNYDRIIETAITLSRHWAPNSFTPEAVSALAVALYNPEFFIFKVHGDIGSAESIVLTSQDYDRLILRSPHVRSFLQAVFLNYTVLFVGYSLRDQDFQLVLRELALVFEGYTATHYALIPDAGPFETEHLLSRLNIRAIPYDSSAGHGMVVDVLAELQKEAPYSVAQPV
jgi:hypothetical protein